MSHEPRREQINITAVDNASTGANERRSEVRIRCTWSGKSGRIASLPAHPLPYSAALAAECASFAASEAPRCGFAEYVPALHNCGAKSVATVNTFAHGARRACVRHAASSHRFGMVVLYDAGYVVAE